MNEKRAIKQRADELVHGRGLAESRSKAQAFIMAGQVAFRASSADNWEKVKKAGQFLAPSVELEVLATHKQDVGRGALKLRRAFELWPQVSAEGVEALDIGSSTGGFTQVLLERGARRVVALDVGTNQLHERLRADPRVLSLEKHHVLKMDDAAWLQAGARPPFGMIVTDVSFISVTKIVPRIPAWLKSGASWFVLVKPQFELGPKKAPGGIVRKAEYHEEAIALVKAAVGLEKDLAWKDVQPSPIEGGDGNREFLAWIQKI